MANKNTDGLVRLEIFPYFNGVNSICEQSMLKKGDLSYAENARCVTIFSVEKRGGTRRLGNSITSTANKHIFFFSNSTATNTGFYRISTVSAVTSIYYLNSSAAWTIISGAGTSLTASTFDSTIAEDNCFLVNGSDNNRYIGPDGLKMYTSADLGSSTTQFDITNTTGSTYRYTYDGTGTDPLVTTYVNVGDVIHITASNFAAVNQGTFIITAVNTNYFEVTNASGSAESNKTIGTGVIRINGHLTNSPKANKINYYKDRLYLGDYTATTRYKTGIVKSSTPLGIVALVDGDHGAGVVTISLTDTKYIYTDDVLDVYRGGTKIETIIVTGKTESTITVLTTANAINSSDELWVGGTYTGSRVFRWAINPESGIDVKQYDTMKMPGSTSERIKMFTNIGGVMAIANNNNIAYWNDSAIQPVDVGIGCCSDRGFVKTLGKLFFLGYNGIYETGGAELPKLISNKVEPYISGASKTVKEAAAMGSKGTSIFCSLSSTTLYHPDGSIKKTLSDVILEKDLKTDNWFVHTGIKAAQFCTYQSSSDADRLEFASTESGLHIMEFLTGQLDDLVTSDKEIFFRIDSGRITLNKNFESFVYPQDIIVESLRGSGIKGFVSLDGGAFYEIKGDAEKGCSILKITSKNENTSEPVRCRQIEISLRDGTKKLCKISRIALRYRLTAEEENQDTISFGK